jgi:hypothetical protein
LIPIDVVYNVGLEHKEAAVNPTHFSLWLLLESDYPAFVVEVQNAETTRRRKQQ